MLGDATVAAATPSAGAAPAHATERALTRATKASGGTFGIVKEPRRVGLVVGRASPPLGQYIPARAGRPGLAVAGDRREPLTHALGSRVLDARDVHQDVDLPKE